MSGAQSTRLMLRAIEGTPLADEPVRSTVVATAHAIAERTGVELLDIATTESSVTVTLATSRIGAIGFLAELRRLTTKWHHDRTGEPSLWGEAPHVFSDDDWDEADEDDDLEFDDDDDDDDDEEDDDGAPWDEDLSGFGSDDDDDEEEDDDPSYDTGEPWR